MSQNTKDNLTPTAWIIGQSRHSLGLWLLIVIGLAASSGCHSDRVIRNVADNLIVQPDPTVELLESELRWMEDNIYRLDGQLEATLRQLESTQRNNAALRLELAQTQKACATAQPVGQVINGPVVGSQVVGSQVNRSSLPPSTTTEDSGQFDEEKETDDDSLYELDTPPVVDLGDTTPPDDDTASDDRPSDTTPSDAIPAAATPSAATPSDPDTSEAELPEGNPTPLGTPEFGAPKSILKQPNAVKPQIELPEDPFKDDEVPSFPQNVPNGVSAPPAEILQVSRIRLNPRLTGGYSFDGKIGHDGVMVVLEPQDAYARYVAVAGPVTVTVRDPSKSGVQGQIGKWSFTETEVAPRLKQTLMGKGIHLELPWPAGSPTTKNVELTVEYQTPRGTTLYAKQPLKIVPTTSALVNQADAAERGFYETPQVSPQVSSKPWNPTR